MLVLLRQYNWLLSYEQQALKVYQQEPGRHLLVQPSAPHAFNWHIEVSNLTFLVGTGTHDILQLLAITDQKFHSLVDLINERSELHKTFQARLESSEIDLGQAVISDVERAVGERIVLCMRSLTDGLYQQMAETLRSMASAGQQVPAVFKTLFPEATFIAFVPLDKSPTA